MALYEGNGNKTEDSIEVAKQGISLVTMGVTPSGETGELHLGHQVTIFNLLKTLEAHPELKGKIFIDDREGDMQQAPSIPSEEKVATTRTAVDSIIKAGSNYLGENIEDRVEIIRMSDFLRSEGLDYSHMALDYVNMLIKRRDVIGSAYSKMKVGGYASITPINEVTGFGNSKEGGSGKYISVLENIIRDKYKMPDNTRIPFEVPIIGENGETPWTTLYPLVPLRDLLLLKGGEDKVLHFFGGDYTLPYGKPNANIKKSKKGNPSKAERIHHVTSKNYHGKNDKMNFITGPLIINGETGAKLSKSKGDREEWVNPKLLDEILETKQSVYDISKDRD